MKPKAKRTEMKGAPSHPGRKRNSEGAGVRDRRLPHGTVEFQTKEKGIISEQSQRTRIGASG